jgi:hypothetical protein
MAECFPSIVTQAGKGGLQLGSPHDEPLRSQQTSYIDGAIGIDKRSPEHTWNLLREIAVTDAKID